MVEFQWRVQYRDGTFVWQYYSDEEVGVIKEHRYKDINRTQVLFFDLLTYTPDIAKCPQCNNQLYYDSFGKEYICENCLLTFEDRLVFRLHIDEPDKRLIWRRRTQISQAMGVDGGEKTVKVLQLVGWQKTVRGENVQVLNLIDEDGNVFCTGEWNPDVAFYTAPQMFDFEQERPKPPKTPTV